MLVAKYIKQEYARDSCTVVVKLDEENLRSLHLKLDASCDISSILEVIVSDPKMNVIRRSRWKPIPRIPVA